VEHGRLFARDDPSLAETFQDVMARHETRPIEARVDAKPGDETERYSMYAFGAQFAEVRVDAELGQISVSRMVGVFDAGRILNAKTARNQFMGGMVWGISMALYEHTMFDE